MRVLTLVDGYRLGGAETLLGTLATVSRQVGFELEVLSLSPATPETTAAVPLLERAGLDPKFLDVKRLLDPSAPGQLVRAIKRSGCDVVHAHLEMAISLGVPAAAVAGRRTVCTFHHVAGPTDRRALLREHVAVAAASRSHCTIFVSQASRAAFAERRWFPGPQPASWTVVHNGVNLDDFAPGPADPTVRTQLGASRPDDVVVVVPGAFRSFKGQEVALRAWPSVLSRHPDVKLAIVGDGQTRGELLALCDELGIADRVTFTGARNDMADIYRAADLVIVPSTSGENLPTVLIEAGGSGRAVVTTRVGGIPDIVVDGVTGRVVGPSDPGAIATAVDELLRDPDRRASLGSAARRRMLSDFSAVVWAQQLLHIYESAAAGRTRRWKS